MKVDGKWMKVERVTCIGCGTTLKNALVAFSDAKWEKLNGKPLCRECALEVAKLVVAEY